VAKEDPKEWDSIEIGFQNIVDGLSDTSMGGEYIVNQYMIVAGLLDEIDKDVKKGRGIGILAGLVARIAGGGNKVPSALKAQAENLLNKKVQ
jgi:hypothetical protein